VGFDGLTSPFYSGTVIDTWGLNNCTYLAGSGDTNDKRMDGSSCIFNDCLSFDGSNDYLSCGSDSSLNLTNGVTITFWLKLNTLPLVNYTELVNKGGGSDPSYRIRVNTNGDFYMEVYNLAYYYDSHNTKLTTDTWYFIAGTYDNTTGQLFLSLNSDRKLCGSSFAGKLSSTAQAIVIGGNGGRSINGTMDEVRIYNSAIPVSQIQALYLAGLEKLLANGGITQGEYYQRIAELNNSVAKE